MVGEDMQIYRNVEAERFRLYFLAVIMLGWLLAIIARAAIG